MTPHPPAGTASRHAAALRWVAGQLAWEDRLEVLRDDPTDGSADTSLRPRADAPLPSQRAVRTRKPVCRPNQAAAKPAA